MRYRLVICVAGLAAAVAVAVAASWAAPSAMHERAARAPAVDRTTPVLYVDTRAGRQAVALDGVVLLSANAAHVRPEGLAQLLRREGYWTSCLAAPGFPSYFGLLLHWTARALLLDIDTGKSRRLCAHPRGVVSIVQLEKNGTPIRTPYGTFKIGQRFESLPRGLRRDLAYGSLQSSDVFAPLADSCLGDFRPDPYKGVLTVFVAPSHVIGSVASALPSPSC